MSTDITVNPVQKFRALLPGDGRTYGTVDSVDATAGTTRVELRDGKIITVKGSGYQVGDRVLIAGGEVRQAVPDLPFNNITLF